MTYDPLTPIVRGGEAEPIVAFADFGELRLSGVNARLVERLEPRRRNEGRALDLAVGKVQPHVPRHVRRGDIDTASRRIGDRPESGAPALEFARFLLVMHDIGARAVRGAFQVRV